MKIFLIKDEAKLSAIIVKLLTENGFLYEHVNNLKLAKEKISLYAYACILLDLMLPNGDGF